MLHSHHVIATALLLAVSQQSTADQATLELKGRRVGQTPAEACQGASVRSQEQLLRDAGLPDVIFPGEACDVHIETVAGVPVPEYARLLFWRGKLIRMVVPFGSLDLAALAALRETLDDAYGPPSVRRSTPFRTDTWNKGPARLELERTDGLPSEVDLYLTHIAGWSEYQKVRDQFSARLEVMKRAQRQRDLRN